MWKLLHHVYGNSRGMNKKLKQHDLKWLVEEHVCGDPNKNGNYEVQNENNKQA